MQTCKIFLVVMFVLCPFTGIFGQQTKKSEDREKTLRLPQSDVHYRETATYIEQQPDADYIHAPEAAYESFRDIKYSIRIHWGVYCLQDVEASWPILNYSGEKKQEYQELYKKFNPVDFNADKWMTDFERWGMQAFAFTCKHHDGFSMWHTKTKVKRRYNYLTQTFEDCDLHYSIEETPFKRDIVKELCDAAHKKNIGIDLYFSHPDWYDADFRPYNYHPLSTPDMAEHPENYYNPRSHGVNQRQTILTPDRTPEETARLIARHREQIHELLTNYGKINMMCFDQWMGKDIWTEIKKTVKLMRQWQPDLMIRARGIGNYGDYYQPEQFVPKAKENTGMPWMSICLLGKQFSYDPNAENYKGAPWVIHNLIDCVAKGGSLMVCLGPDEKGNFHPVAMKQLDEAGKWLKVNGEGIYETRACEDWQTDNIYFTQSKNHKTVYAFTEKWPGTELIIPSVTPVKGSKVYMLGYQKSLKWSQTDKGVKIVIPDEFQSPENRPCEHAWGFRIEYK